MVITTAAYTMMISYLSLWYYEFISVRSSDTFMQLKCVALRSSSYRNTFGYSDAFVTCFQSTS